MLLTEEIRKRIITEIRSISEKISGEEYEDRKRKIMQELAEALKTLKK